MGYIASPSARHLYFREEFFALLKYDNLRAGIPLTRHDGPIKTGSAAAYYDQVKNHGFIIVTFVSQDTGNISVTPNLSRAWKKPQMKVYRLCPPDQCENILRIMRIVTSAQSF